MFSIVWPVDVAAAINAFAIESLDLVTVREAVGGVARRAGLPSCRKRRLRPGFESGTKFRAQRPYPDRRIGVKLSKTETMLTAPFNQPPPLRDNRGYDESRCSVADAKTDAASESSFCALQASRRYDRNYQGARHSSQMPQPSSSRIDFERRQQMQVCSMSPNMASGGRISISDAPVKSTVSSSISSSPGSRFHLRWGADPLKQDAHTAGQRLRAADAMAKQSWLPNFAIKY